MPHRILKIRELYKRGGITQEEVAKQFGVGQTQIGRIVRKDNWNHIGKQRTVLVD